MALDGLRDQLPVGDAKLLALGGVVPCGMPTGKDAGLERRQCKRREDLDEMKTFLGASRR